MGQDRTQQGSGLPGVGCHISAHGNGAPISALTVLGGSFTELMATRSFFHGLLLLLAWCGELVWSSQEVIWTCRPVHCDKDGDPGLNARAEVSGNQRTLRCGIVQGGVQGSKPRRERCGPSLFPRFFPPARSHPHSLLSPLPHGHEHPQRAKQVPAQKTLSPNMYYLSLSCRLMGDSLVSRSSLIKLHSAGGSVELDYSKIKGKEIDSNRFHLLTSGAGKYYAGDFQVTTLYQDTSLFQSFFPSSKATDVLKSLKIGN